ncbi:hypothetical protein GGR52DRAFT_544891 [Hypoxylon sp. FL1284]|nr:hypothetical protein GGR52DRAFT_544891 [Hypoxylon sp. FL1284]
MGSECLMVHKCQAKLIVALSTYLYVLSGITRGGTCPVDRSAFSQDGSLARGQNGAAVTQRPEPVRVALPDRDLSQQRRPYPFLVILHSQL